MIKPMLAQLSPKPFDDPEHYIWEEKFDGIRAVVVVDGLNHRIFARSGTEKTALFPELDIQTNMPCILDGEIISAKGDFNSIQHRANRINGIHYAVQEFPAEYRVFDVIELKGVNIKNVPLSKRKEVLGLTFKPTDNAKLTYYTSDGVLLFEKMISEGKEGVIGKRLSSAYLENKRGWLKVKCNKEGEFVVCGYTPGLGWRDSTFGALVLAKQDVGSLVYVGLVGTGFTSAEIALIFGHLRSLVTGIALFPCPEPVVIWVKPELVIKVRYLEYTNDGHLRFPAYKGLVPEGGNRCLSG